MNQHTRLIAAAAILGALLAGCAPKPAAEADKAAAPAAAGPVLAASIHEIMQSEVAPNADILWKSVGSVNNKEVKPETDEDWQKLRHAAITLSEVPNLLVMDGRQVVKAGAKVQDEGQEGNLPAAEMQTRIAADRASFVMLAKGLQDAAVKAVAAVDAKNVDAISEVGGAIDEACEACHVKFWYPATAAAAAAAGAPEREAKQ